MRRPSLWERWTRGFRERDSVRKALLRGASWSGSEPNHFFLNLEGRQFKDVSAVAGLDDLADGRSFGIFDYDRDGWPDFALANKNEPRVELYRNGIGRLSDRRSVAVRFVGGNRSSGPSEWSSRSGYGARLTLRLGERSLLREHRCGEGFAAQNSATLLVGIGDAEQVDTMTVRWPSGRVQEIDGIAAGSLVTLYENPADAPGPEPFVVAAYSPDQPVATPLPERRPSALPSLRLTNLEAVGSRLRLVTTLATWCIPCRREVPVLADLRGRFSVAELGLYGVAIDPEDGAGALARWRDELEPPYRILEVSDDERESVQRLVASQLGSEGVPATLIVDDQDRVLHAQWGPPTVSTVRRLLRSTEAGNETAAP